MLQLIAQTFFLFLPAAIANCAPVLFKWVPVLQQPVDGGRMYKGKRMLGDHKTWRGILSGSFMGMFVIGLEAIYIPADVWFSPMDYSSVNVYFLGFLFGFGAMVGDSIKSFFKRRQAIQPGDSWIPFDQLDWIIGAGLFASLYISINPRYLIIAMVLFGILHPITNIISHKLGIQEKPL